MTRGDMVYNQVTLLNGQYMDIKPSVAGIEWMINNIIIPFGYACELYHSDGSNDILDCTTSTSLHTYTYHCNTSSYYRLNNVSGSTIQVSFDGIITKE